MGFWDPLSPILITREMTRQQYFPENLITGSGLSDTTTAGRLYDARAVVALRSGSRRFGSHGRT